MKRLILLLLVVSMFVLPSCVSGIEQTTPDIAGSVSLLVHCETVLEKGISTEDYPGIPVIFDGKADFYDGDTAFDIINRALMAEKVQMDFDDSAYGKYFKGIANIYAGDFGDMSGWLFKVNGEYAEVGCSLYDVKDGDVIEFVYSCEMGDTD